MEILIQQFYREKQGFFEESEKRIKKFEDENKKILAKLA